MSVTFNSANDAYNFLKKLGASDRLLLHVKLVGETAELIIARFLELKFPFDPDFVRVGVILHDAGKILHPEELSEKGNKHETAGEKFLLMNGVDSEIARCCQTHGKWQTMDCSFEEYLIALSDKLWKGKRVEQLETIIVDLIADKLGLNRWQLLVELDIFFEQIAADGDSKLLKSRIN